MLKLFSFLIVIILAVPVHATPQTEEEIRAGQEIYIKDLRLIHGPGNIKFGYVLEDAVPGGGKYFCGKLTHKQAQDSATIIQSAMQKLPQKSLEDIHLKYLLMCSQAKAQNKSIGGIPVPPLRLLMLSVGTTSQRSTDYLSYVFLHELYHLFEFSYGIYHDPVWDAEFTGYSNQYPQELKVSPIGSGKPGFINAYGMSFPHEERAEIFALLMLQSSKVYDHIKATEDTVLLQKLDHVRTNANQYMGIELP
tara:strand:- start:1222 stop:1971 length:750 start_codon:yes stop_codon:yes gene_type:complete